MEINFNIFLDDYRLPSYTNNPIIAKDSDYQKLDWIIRRDYDEFVSVVRRIYADTGKAPSVVSFDHDLATEHYGFIEHPIPYEQFKHKTGYDCAKWLINFCVEKGIDLPIIKIHTLNEVGKINIQMLVNNYHSNKLKNER